MHQENGTPKEFDAVMSNDEERNERMRFSPWNDEHCFLNEKAKIVLAPDAHGLMLEKSSLKAIVPEI